MYSPTKKKRITIKKWEHLFKQTEHIQEQKKFNPGEIKFNLTDYPTDKSRAVNFFGDIHTEVFAVKVSADDKYVGAACSNGEVKIYDVNEGKVINIGNTSRLAGYPCTGFKWKPKRTEQFVTCNCDGTIKWYNRYSQLALYHH